MVNPYREPGMEAYWIPSDLESAAFGTKISDEFFQVKTGGDIAFLHGVTRIVIEENWYDADFINEHTAEFDTLRGTLQSFSWEHLEREAGLSKAEMHACATLIKNAEKAVFVWGMGITQHQCGENNVHAIINLALMKGFVGREGCGLMPIRGHSGVQGGAEMGAYASTLPGGLSINSENAAKLSEQYGFKISDIPGITTPEMLDAASAGEIDVLFAAGGNFKEVMPDPQGVTGTLQKIPLRVHMDIVLNPQMFIDPAETVILLPAMTRYEIPGGVTETSTERRIIFSPEIEGHRIEQARSEWDVVSDLAARLHPEHADKVRFESTAAIREEIGDVVSYYDGIQNLTKEGDSMQYGGARLCEGWNFPTPDGKAHFKAAPLPDYGLADDEFMLVTRRGKQFNSIIHDEVDSLNHEKRDALLINQTDATRLNIKTGDTVLLENTHGRYRGVASIVDVAPGTVQVYWPEGNMLLDPQARSPLAKIPAYKSVNVRLKKL
ncbi:MAG: molybdopterin-dependent oxidoreductase [Aggregatilineales bacterium]